MEKKGTAGLFFIGRTERNGIDAAVFQFLDEFSQVDLIGDVERILDLPLDIVVSVCLELLEHLHCGGLQLLHVRGEIAGQVNGHENDIALFLQQFLGRCAEAVAFSWVRSRRKTLLSTTLSSTMMSTKSNRRNIARRRFRSNPDDMETSFTIFCCRVRFGS